MKIQIQYAGHDKVLKIRTCKVCGRRFFAYSNGRIICSSECRRIDNSRYTKTKLARLKENPEAMYKHRKSIIDKRETERKSKIRKDLPAIKKALAKGDEYLVDFLFNNYGKISGKRTYKKPPLKR